MKYGKTDIIVCEDEHDLGRHRFTIVPLASKRPIMTRVLAAEAATEEIPATIIRNYEGKLYLDENSYPG
tara:strand:- start:619 stop:825 length:207 start_codon:yes stop_codon:yes gene_type:complete